VLLVIIIITTDDDSDSSVCVDKWYYEFVGGAPFVHADNCTDPDDRCTWNPCKLSGHEILHPTTHQWV